MAGAWRDFLSEQQPWLPLPAAWTREQDDDEPVPEPVPTLVPVQQQDDAAPR